jgi:hypothetical protein
MQSQSNTALAELPDARCGIPEDLSRLSIIEYENPSASAQQVLNELRRDQVAIIRNVAPENADVVMAAVADAVNLRASLEVQAGFAAIKGHRDNIGQYFMSVNKTSDYEFIGAHSEGTHFTNMQIAALYCYENTTDGGETVLLNVDQNSPSVQNLKEITWKIRLVNRELSPGEIAMAKMKWQIDIPRDLLSDTDEVVRKRESFEEGIELYEVLTKTPKAYSRILDRHLHVYWDNISSTDYASIREYRKLLEDEGLLRLPPGGATTEQLDHSSHRRVWNSGIRYSDLFKNKIIRKLVPGELVVINNLTWTHAIANWTPGSGTRKIAVAFA